ncbi:hypothetical protein DdX_06278 [Ditylenchus destructor]|uniref:Uncharacterized protein n=1 Tax=Ditylenchus destructor TaxID=166010 RepID=A0AAD4NAG7_9BILA|nr:hypothetical protein DdX_06278 [Ditylenchus destructor]
MTILLYHTSVIFVFLLAIEEVISDNRLKISGATNPPSIGSYSVHSNVYQCIQQCIRAPSTTFATTKTPFDGSNTVHPYTDGPLEEIGETATWTNVDETDLSTTELQEEIATTVGLNIGFGMTDSGNLPEDSTTAEIPTYTESDLNEYSIATTDTPHSDFDITTTSESLEQATGVDSFTTVETESPPTGEESSPTPVDSLEPSTAKLENVSTNGEIDETTDVPTESNEDTTTMSTSTDDNTATVTNTLENEFVTTSDTFAAETVSTAKGGSEESTTNDKKAGRHS